MSHQSSVLIVFSHDLLGEGLAARLRGLGVRATAVRSGDVRRSSAALRRHPDVIVTETSDEECLERVRRLSPDSRVVDVSDAVGPGYPLHTVRFDVILEALEDEGEDEDGD